ncbi:hypothetical protein ACWGJ2_21690 [Streptomyces sp. NPDC054796]|uniref:Uncharacterized protein n=1 Tax=Streptomyces daliensis TaxID=299421 RepID=A0A8T4IPA1_9ACTN|nr:hypothetical protein [Streptomyces daliensis]
MPTSPDPVPESAALSPNPPLPSAAEANAALRAFASGRTSWTPSALAELDRLRSTWQAAVRREIVRAA